MPIHRIERCRVLQHLDQALLVASPYLPSELWVPTALIYDSRHAFHTGSDGLPGPLLLHQAPLFPEPGDRVVLAGGVRCLVLEVRAESINLGTYGWKRIGAWWPVWGESDTIAQVWRDGRKIHPPPDPRLRPDPGMVVQGRSGRQRQVLFVLYRGAGRNPLGWTHVRARWVDSGRTVTIRASSWRSWARDCHLVE